LKESRGGEEGGENEEGKGGDLEQRRKSKRKDSKRRSYL
jgi:hypothetical protein